MRWSVLAIVIGVAIAANLGSIATASAQTELQAAAAAKLQKDARDGRAIRAHRRRLQKEKKRLAHERIVRNSDQPKETRPAERDSAAASLDKRRAGRREENKTDKKDGPREENHDRVDRNATVQDRSKAANGL